LIIAKKYIILILVFKVLKFNDEGAIMINNNQFYNFTFWQGSSYFYSFESVCRAEMQKLKL